MNWYSLALALLFGAIAGIIVALVSARGERKSTVYIVGILTYLSLNALSKEYILPRIELYQIESGLLETPIFNAIKRYDPGTYDSIIHRLQEGIDRNQGQLELIGEVRARMEAMMLKRVPVASDAAAVDYMKAQVHMMRFFYAQDSDLCYRFMFPQLSAPFNPATYLPKPLMQEVFTAQAAIIQTSAEHPQPIPSEHDVRKDMDQVMRVLHREHGSKIAIYQQLLNPSVNKDDACDMTANLYDAVMQLPIERSGKLLRFMQTQG